MDWTHTFTIIGALGAFVIYVSSRTDKKIDTFEARIEATVEKSKKELKAEIRDLDKKIEGVQKDLNQIAINVSNVEGQITQMTRPEIIPIKKYQQQYTEPPEEENPPKKAQNQ